MILVSAFIIDLVFGEYPSKFHPVVWIGKIAEFWYQKFHFSSKNKDLCSGALLSIFLCFLFGGTSYLVSEWNSGLSFLVTIFLLKSSFSYAALLKAGQRMYDTLTLGDLIHAKFDLMWLCSRKSDGFRSYDFTNGAISSIAENLSDSFIAPLFWYSCFGLKGAMVYRVVNTLDAKFGYKTKAFLHFGFFAAKADDLLNYIPSRLTSILIIFVSFFQSDISGYQAFKATIRDSSLTPSPNSGWPMSAVAGGLDFVLSKPRVYRLNSDGLIPTTRHLLMAIELIRVTALFFLLCLIIGGSI